MAPGAKPPCSGGAVPGPTDDIVHSDAVSGTAGLGGGSSSATVVVGQLDGISRCPRVGKPSDPFHRPFRWRLWPLERVSSGEKERAHARRHRPIGARSRTG